MSVWVLDGVLQSASAAPIGAQYVTLATDATLTAERVLTAGTGIDLTDAGAGSTITIDVDLKANGGLVIESTELAVDLGASSITGTLAVGDGGTGAVSFTDAGVLLGNSTGAIQVTTAGTAGQVLTSNGTGVDPTFQTASGAEWTDTGTTLHPNETGDEVVLGNTTPVSSAKFSIDGDANQIQCVIQGFSTQTARMFVVENSAGTDFLDMSGDGETTLSSIAGASVVPLTVNNNFDSADNTVFRFVGPNRATATDGDTIHHNCELENSSGSNANVVQHRYIISTVTAGAEDGRFQTRVKLDGNFKSIFDAQMGTVAPHIKINGDDADVNFSIGSAQSSNMFFIDANESEVAIHSGGAAQGATLHVKNIADKNGFIVKGHSTQTANLVVFESSSVQTVKISVQGVIDYNGTMGNGTQNPATDAPTDWVQIKIAGTTYYLPAYT